MERSPRNGIDGHERAVPSYVSSFWVLCGPPRRQEHAAEQAEKYHFKAARALRVLSSGQLCLEGRALREEGGIRQSALSRGIGRGPRVCGERRLWL